MSNLSNNATKCVSGFSLGYLLAPNYQETRNFILEMLSCRLRHVRLHRFVICQINIIFYTKTAVLSQPAVFNDVCRLNFSGKNTKNINLQAKNLSVMVDINCTDTA